MHGGVFRGGAPETRRRRNTGTGTQRPVSGRQDSEKGQAAATGEPIARAAAVCCQLPCMPSVYCDLRIILNGFNGRLTHLARGARGAATGSERSLTSSAWGEPDGGGGGPGAPR